jgi:hypothetical protein
MRFYRTETEVLTLSDGAKGTDFPPRWILRSMRADMEKGDGMRIQNPKVFVGRC